MKRIITAAAILLITLVPQSCTKYLTREDLDKMTERTFYLLPVESAFRVPASIDSWKAMEERIGEAVAKGVKEMDPVKVKESLEKRYGITVDISLFEKAKTDEKESVRYYRALKDPNATGSSSFAGTLSPGYKGYMESDLFYDIKETRKTKSHIIINHESNIEGNNIKTVITVRIIAIEGDKKRELRLTRSLYIPFSVNSGFIGSVPADYEQISKSLSGITGFRYNDAADWKYSEAECPYLDGSM